jgi:predicted HicB family RNase H-like nuclease
MSEQSDYKGPKYPTQAHGSIPAFHSYEEEAAWWDETDTGAPEFEDEFTSVQVRHRRGYTKQLMFRVDEETDQELEQLAEERGIKKATLVRIFVRERLRQEREQHKRAS